MDRRQFLRHTAPLAVAPLLMQGVPLRAYGRSPILDLLSKTSETSDRVLVIIQLNGGNDGLNTVIPLDQYSALSAARGNILIPEDRVLKLTSSTGLHPALAPLRALYDDGKLGIIQGVSYPRPNLSHFRSTDIWLTASDSNQVLNTGWLGRFLEYEHPGFPGGYPTPEVPHPVAIQIGSIVSPGFHGPDGPTGIAVSNPNSTYTLPGGFDIPPDSPAGHELTFIRHVAEQTEVYSSVIREASSRAQNLSGLYPASGNSLANQLKIVARLIGGGLMTRVYIVNLGGFDTHSGQVASGAPETGNHAVLLTRIAQAVAAFQDDLRLLGVEKRVLGFTFSEFGRRIASNASLGTDHGTAAPMLFFGANARPGIVGSSPAIPAGATNRDNLSMQFDFRAVYASVLRDWFGATSDELQAVLLQPFDTLPVVRYSAIASNSDIVPVDYSLMQNFPNPFNPWTTIGFDLAVPSSVRLVVYDSLGKEVAVLADGPMEAGRRYVEFNGRGLASGVYYYRLEAGSFVETRRMILMR
jgi:uncharacterized protein (DUF1501 family)